MKNLNPIFRKHINANDVIAKCLKKAKQRFPEHNIALCGYAESWYDCLTGYTIGSTLYVLFYYNINEYTHAVTFTKNLSRTTGNF